MEWVKELLIANAVSIGGFLFMSIVVFHVVEYYFSNKKIRKNKIAGPLFGALMGAIPGCGAAIAMVTLYKDRKATFGAIIATFIATLGDGTFALMSFDIIVYLKVGGIAFILGIIAGKIYDIAVGDNLCKEKVRLALEDEHNHTKIEEISDKFLSTYGFVILFITGAALGVFGIIELFGVNLTSALLVRLVAYIFVFTSLIYYIIDRFVHKHTNCSCRGNLHEQIVHGIRDMAMVMSFIIIGTLISTWLIDIVVGENQFATILTNLGPLLIVGATVFGLLPGCTTYIAVVSLYIASRSSNSITFPLSAVVAASVATSGDGIFPLIIADKKGSIKVTTLSGIVAIFVGFTMFFFNY